jgi:undecaprenyl-diphosphatase
MGTKLIRLDAGVVRWVCGRRRHPMDRAMVAATRLGDGPLWVLLTLAMPFISSKGWRALGVLAVAFAVEQAIYHLVKRATTRLRPFAAIPGVTGLVVPPDEFSFPSGHTAAAFVMVTASTVLLPLLVLPLSAAALLIGVSRVYLGVHFPSDVLAGAVVGVLSGMAGLMTL